MGKEPAQIKSSTSKGGGKETHSLREMSIRPADNGGATVEHHFRSSGSMGSYKDPETHAFGPNDLGKLKKHLTKHLGTAFTDATGAAENELTDK